MYIQANKVSTCVSVSCTNVCNEIGGQVGYVIIMPWYNLFTTNVPIQNVYTDYAEIIMCTASGATSNLCC